MKNITRIKYNVLLLLLAASMTASAQNVGKKLESKASETIDKVIGKIDVDSFFSKKKKTKKVKLDPEEVGDKITGNQTVGKGAVGQQTESTGISSPKEKSGKYVVYYQDIMMGDQKNTKFGPFFVPHTGHCVDIETANEMQGDVAMVFFSGYGGAMILTFPANAKESDLSTSYDDIDMFKEDGMGGWEQENINSGELYKGSMSDLAFEKLMEDNSWKAFNAAYSNNMDGQYANYTNPTTGVYCIKFSNSLRALMRIKNIIPKSTKGGSMKFDIIVERK
ncbi:hypothetical protein LZQ00_06945 [Sphingobacterium sp. SRCM116780]|uniref:hypothetical protein n=1 Tax=Sphingobacterium sp. SRCM116780 TaxID=2907623 RepID=UPI001F487ECE|nr:hypothetical protein [Sphingobacterium sp. SRCM116780]UIR57549.1 hypothetical protein LZQ00_06945 [Sphingobacterium sp. SRCM116780]